jgi:hypothetical protein
MLEFARRRGFLVLGIIAAAVLASMSSLSSALEFRSQQYQQTDFMKYYKPNET